MCPYVRERTTKIFFFISSQCLLEVALFSTDVPLFSLTFDYTNSTENLVLEFSKKNTLCSLKR